MILEHAPFTRIGEPLIGTPYLLAKWGIFINVGIYSKGFACRESCYVNRQVSRILEIYIYICMYVCRPMYIYTYIHTYGIYHINTSI